MHVWWGNDAGPDAVMMYDMIIVFATIGLALFFVLLLARTPGGGEKSAREVLAERFARGEISSEEYKARKRLISDS